MEIKSNWARLALAAVVVLLAATGGITLANMAALNDLEQQLGSLFSQSEAVTQPGSDTSASPTAVGGDAASSPGETQALQPTATPFPHPIQVVFPGASDLLVLSSAHPVVEIALRVSEAITLSQLTAQLTLIHRVEGEKQKSVLSPGVYEVYAASDKYEAHASMIEAQRELVIRLPFSAAKLPPAGAYEGILQITSQDFAPLAKPVNVVVVRTAYGLQSRAFQAPDGEKMIVISGVRDIEDWLAQWNHAQADISWNAYTLKLWEPNLLPGARVEIVSSELADLASGRSGILEVTPGVVESLAQPVTVSLAPSGIFYPGAYSGVINFVLPGGALQQSIPVKALLRDSLWMPFWVILIGVLVSGYAFRYLLGDVSKNMAYQRHLIQQAYDELVETRAFPRNPTCDDIKDLLVNASAALHWNDYTRAAAELKSANDKLALLKEVESLLAQVESIQGSQQHRMVKQAQTAYQQGDLANARKLLLEYLESQKPTVKAFITGLPPQPIARVAVQTTNGGFYFPAGAAITLVRPTSASFRLYHSAADISQPQESDLVGQVNWSFAQAGAADDPVKDGATLSMTFTQTGLFLLKAKADQAGIEGRLTIRVIEDPAITALRNQALLSTLAWAVIASVAGLLYIEARIPTFGSAQDYLLALGWALGLGVASKPTESLVATTLKSLSGRAPAPPTGEKPAVVAQTPAKPEPQEPKGGEEIKVPALEDRLTRKQVEEKLKQAGLTLEPDPKDAGEDWIIVLESVAPKPGEPAGAGKKVTVKFTKPGADKTNEDKENPGDG